MSPWARRASSGGGERPKARRLGRDASGRERAADATAVSVEIIDLQTVWPLDVDTVVSSVEKTGRCVVVHEAPRAAGMAAEIIAQINDRVLYHLEAPVERMTGYDVPMPLFAREASYFPDAADVERAITRAVDRRTARDRAVQIVSRGPERFTDVWAMQ